jgi:hypothetical protein
VFWRPETYARTIVLTPAPAHGRGAFVYRPEAWPGAYVEREASDGRHAILTTASGAHRLWMPAPISPGSAVACVVPLGADAAHGAAAILSFWRVLTGAGLTGPPPADARLRRARLSLQALDGRHEGASYRALAERLFGVQRVAAEAWRTSSLRDATIRLVRTGQLFSDGQYRRLLGYRSED